MWQIQEFRDYLAADPVDGFVIAGVELMCCVLFAAFGTDSARRLLDGWRAPG